jgi:hypothetical protein
VALLERTHQRLHGLHGLLRNLLERLHESTNRATDRTRDARDHLLDHLRSLLAARLRAYTLHLLRRFTILRRKLACSLKRAHPPI